MYVALCKKIGFLVKKRGFQFPQYIFQKTWLIELCLSKTVTFRFRRRLSLQIKLEESALCVCWSCCLNYKLYNLSILQDASVYKWSSKYFNILMRNKKIKDKYSPTIWNVCFRKSKSLDFVFYGDIKKNSCSNYNNSTI